MANFAGQQSQRFRHDVFISFRGEDTRHNFIGYLRKELKRKGIITFTDDEMLKVGDVISPALSEAIEESKVLIVVLSENYASSTWCLEELVKILECSRKGNQQLVFPIFYHVEPSDVRHQRGKFREAMRNRFGKNSARILTWRSALNQVCQYAGRHISISTGYETNDVEAIVDKVYKKITPKRLDGKDRVGLEQRTQEVKSLLDMKPYDDIVLMLGIYGLEGIGKTELAKALYNEIVHQFEAASFLANVREKSNKINGPEDLQKTLLSEMFEVLETELGSTSRGVNEIKRRLGKKKILLVLDDVDDIEQQLNNLAGGCDWFGSGSRIIITTRDKDLLIAHKVKKIYKMIELDDQHSRELFGQNAFGKNHPENNGFHQHMGGGGVGPMSVAMNHPQMVNIPAVQGLPAAAVNGGGGGGPDVMPENPYQQQLQQQQLQQMAATMNQQRAAAIAGGRGGGGIQQSMMCARPPPAVNYMYAPYPNHSPHDPYTYIFSDENTSSCNVM